MEFYNTNITKFGSIFFHIQSNKTENKTLKHISDDISGHIRHQNHMGLIAEENSDGSRRTIMTKEIIIVQVTTVSTTTTVISPIAAAAAKASWNKPDINDHLSADERKRLSDSMEKREWLTKRPVSPLRRKTLSKLPNL
ncbi:unnamed protein product [Rhizophagus irregularis]|nr:unnamed protein product [Rhizophagus irregularis]